ncbi:hypothetical protein QE152_g13674 [Popillia japonica]|uniref:Uncharacterized protein n=1 Tax=Popillia japonica TaxID=7064 RepID=A0AAW1LC02_POPJA
MDLPESVIPVSSSTESHDQPTPPSLANVTQQSDSVINLIHEENLEILPTPPSLANVTQQSDSVINLIHEENLEILEFINPLPVSLSDKVLGWPQFPNDLIIKYRPCTPTESGIIKETQGNDVPITLSKPGCSKTYYV